MLSITTIATKRINDPLPTNVQHLMEKLSTFFKINYIEPPVDLVYLLRNVNFILRLFRKIEPSNLRKFIPIILPFEGRFSKIKKINEKLVLIQIKIFLKITQSNRNLLWIFSPKHYFLAGKFKEWKLYFHITDDYLAFPKEAGLGPPDLVKAQERYLMQRADRIFVTSTYLAKLKSEFANKIEMVPNVADNHHFQKAQSDLTEIPIDLVTTSKPIIGFVGAIDRFKVDFEIIEYCAKQNPNFTFIMIGPIGHGDGTVPNKLPRNENICYLGKKPYDRLPNYIKAFDVCMIPYRRNSYTQGCFPLKFHEYLAAGKPVVATDLPAFDDFRHIMYIGDTPGIFNQRIRQALKEDNYERIEIRQKIADENSWDKRAMHIKQIIIDDQAA